MIKKEYIYMFLFMLMLTVIQSYVIYFVTKDVILKEVNATIYRNLDTVFYGNEHEVNQISKYL